MPSSRLATSILLLALLLPAAARARAWQGVTPGQTGADEVVQKLGEPTSRVKRGPRLVLAYKADQALPGTKEAQFHCRADGVVEEITVFLDARLDAESIEGTYGRPQVKTFTDTFQKVWQYPRTGVTVFFDREGGVQAITFQAGTAPARGAEPKGAAEGAPTAPEGSPTSAR
jgi:hypothetical protein